LSIGSPTRGKLRGGSRLFDQTGLFVREPVRANWGLPLLVSLLERSALHVRKRFPGSVLLVGDLSHQYGGPIEGHRSHETGRDADIGFYFTDHKGKPKTPSDFVRVAADGRVIGQPELLFDDPRNWALVQALLTDSHARVQHVFVAAILRARLLAYARRVGVYWSLQKRAALALKQPTRGLSHDDHFHVRIGCPPHQDMCLAEPAPRPGGSVRRIARRGPGPARARTSKIAASRGVRS
jgi:penicillin-insensitive murein endopeptidase